MEGAIDVVGAVASVLTGLVLVYYACVTAFNWRKVSQLAGFVLLAGGIFYFLLNKTAPEEMDTLAVSCKVYGDKVRECNGWLFTYETVYNLMNSARSALQNSAIAQGQSKIAAGFFVLLALLLYTKALMQRGLLPLVFAAVTILITWLVVYNLAEIQRQANLYVDMVMSLGTMNHEESYKKLQYSFDSLKDLTVKFDALAGLQFESEMLGNAIGTVLTWYLTLVFAIISCVNLVLFSLQILLLVLLPSALAVRLAMGSYDLGGILTLIFLASLSRAYIVIQMFAINILNIQDNFTDLTKSTIGAWVEVGVTMGLMTLVMFVAIAASVVFIWIVVKSGIKGDMQRVARMM